jgi:mannosyltransferase
VGEATARNGLQELGSTLRAFGWKEGLALAAPAILLAGLAIGGLDLFSFWRDEIASVVFSKHSVRELLMVIDRDRSKVGLANMATYYLFLHFWLKLGEAEAQVRLLSVVFGALTVIPVYFLARRLANWPAGLAAALVFALHPVVIHYAYEARGYSLAMLITASLTLLVLIATERRSAWPWLAYGVIGALGLYVHFFIALVIAAHAGWVLAARRFPGWLSAAAVTLPLVVAAAPVPLIIRQYGGGHGWIADLSLHQLWVTMISLSGGVLLLAALGLAAVGAVALRRRDPGTWLSVATFAVPIVADVIMSMWKPLLVARYLVICLPPFAVLAGVGIVSLPRWPLRAPAALRAAAAVVVAAPLLLALPSAYADQHGQDWRSLAAWIADDAAPGDRLLIRRWGARMLDFYLDRSDADPRPKAISRAFADRPQPDARVWLVLRVEADVPDTVLLDLREHYDIVEQREFGQALQAFLLGPR